MRLALSMLLAFIIVGAMAPTVRAEIFTRTVLLLPTSDDASAGWTPTGCVTGWDCVDEDPPHDADTTYLAANPASPGVVVSSFQVGNLPNEALNVLSVSAFMWGRVETATAAIVAYVTLTQVGVDCSSIPLLPSETYYTNATVSQPDDCSGVAWTTTSVNLLVLTVECEDDGVPPAEPNCRVTSVGLVVSYTYTGGSLTENEWDTRLSFTAFALLLLIGVFGKRPIFVFLAGICGTFLAFSAFFITGQEWSLVLFIALGPLLMLVAGFDMLVGREAKKR